MRVAVVGAGLAGLATAAALNRTGHQVTVHEQAGTLRSSGLAINLWSNATSLLPGLGIPADAIPGEPFARMLFRAAGREVAAVELPATGLPHVTVERGALLDALAATLPDDAVRYGVRRTEVGDLAREHDLVVVADGTNSSLRPAVTGSVGRRWTWRIWQGSATADVPEVPSGTGAAIIRPGLFSGIWRLGGKRFTWFVEQPGRESGGGERLLRELRDDEDSVVRTLAAATSARDWTEWHAQDMWPRRRLHRGNVVLVGDAAHAMLPTLGQGACQSVEDAATLAAAVGAWPDLESALRRYEAARVPRLRRLLALTRAGAVSRRPDVTSRTMPVVLATRAMARSAGPVLRMLSRPRIPVPRQRTALS